MKATERIALVVDAIVRGRGMVDAREAAKQLAEVADDARARRDRRGAREDRARGKARADADAIVLEGGRDRSRGSAILGRDLGEIVSADLLRIARGRGGEEWAHAELAARDLVGAASRSRSVVRRARQGGRRGGRVGRRARHARRGRRGRGDDVDKAFQQVAQELEQIANDHASNEAKSQQALAQGAGEEDLK